MHKLRKTPERDKLICTKIRLSIDAPEKAFVKAWNTLVDDYEIYEKEWLDIMGNGDVLEAYRAKELIRLVKDIGHIETITSELSTKVLDHILVGLDGSLEVVYLSGTRVKV